MQLRDRIKELRRVKAGDLLPDPRNWRRHPKAQMDALEGVLREIGIADALLARELDDGRLMLIDGHGRQEIDRQAVWPVLVLDVDEAEAAEIMATLDPLAAMAETDARAMDALLAGFETQDAAVQAMLDDLSGNDGRRREDRTLEEIDADTLPERPIWVLCAVPVEAMPQVAPLLDQLAALGVTVEMSDGATRDG